MGYWGWRPLLLCVFMSVWVVSCSNGSDPATSVFLPPTDLPSITLTVREPPHSITEAPPGLPTAATTMPTASLSPDDDDDPARVRPVASDVPRLQTPTPLPLNLPDPLCFETTEGGILCLGRVDNPLHDSVQRAAVRVDLFQPDGTLLGQRETLLEQRIIPAGESAPYRALFPGGEEQALHRQFGNASSYLLRAEWTARDAGQSPPLRIEASSGRLEHGWYVVDVEITNLDEEEATRIRLVVTLYNDNEQVMGYRVVETATIGPQKTTLIRVEVLPQAQGTSLRHTVHVEAQR